MAKKNLQIKSIGVYKLIIPLKEPFVISLGAQYNAESIIAVIKTENDLTGYGECSPYMSINGESIDTCFIVGQYLAKVLKEKNALDIKACVQAMDKTIYGNSSIKSAFDMALYDVASQHAGLPLYKFLGGKNNKTLVTDYTVSIGKAKKMAEDAARYKQQGFPVIKVKLGESTHKDAERIHLIREAIGYEIPLRIDANQGWDVKTAIDTLKELERYNIQHCEEPIPRWDFMRLRKVRKKSPIPIMADESCCNHHDAKRLISLKACDMLNLKLGKSGGIYDALKIISLAEKAKIKMQVGAFMESRLGMTAFAHLALCSDNILYCDFDTPLMFTEDPVSGGLTYHENGVVTVPETPGLGAWIEEERLNQMGKMIL
ncbi:MAG TPA: dipeptide epimerase [Chitinophagaceae bacterium]|jgi:o-succinylbenzoate synthase|nr:dipeptide epimerase [Chitinophagaceae bacterium]